MYTEQKNLMPTAIVVASVLISVSIFYLAFSINKSGLNLSDKERTKEYVAGVTPTIAENNNKPTVPAIKKVKIDNDPVLGSADAPVTIIEFSDYECPFCKRHFESTYPELIKKFIDTGKVKLVFRDLPLAFHNPQAIKDAIGANCVKEQGGDEAYFKIHKRIFESTAGNGTGISEANWSKLASELNLNVDEFTTCLEDKDGKQKAEIEADLTYANSIGANGTPTFFIGKSTTTGEIEGETLIGAQPFSVFETIIKKYLD